MIAALCYFALTGICGYVAGSPWQVFGRRLRVDGRHFGELHALEPGPTRRPRRGRGLWAHAESVRREMERRTVWISTHRLPDVQTPNVVILRWNSVRYSASQKLVLMEIHTLVSRHYLCYYLRPMRNISLLEKVYHLHVRIDLRRVIDSSFFQNGLFLNGVIGSAREILCSHRWKWWIIYKFRLFPLF